MLFFFQPKILHGHCLQFLLGVKMAAKETENNTCSKFGGDKKKELYGMLWYFLEWSIDSITTCLAHAPKKCTQSGKFQFDINSPFENTVYPKTKDAFPKIQAWAYSRYSHLHRSCLRNIREFKMSRQLTATKTSHEKWTRIFSVFIVIIPTRLLCQMQENSSGAEFLSTIAKFIEKKKILSLLVYVLHKTWK